MAESKTAARQAAEGKPKHKMFEIIVALGDDQEPRRQFIGADGMDFEIERGKPVTVPEPVLGVLDSAVKLVPEVDPADPAGLRTISVPRQRFPYTVLRAI